MSKTGRSLTVAVLRSHWIPGFETASNEKTPVACAAGAIVSVKRRWGAYSLMANSLGVATNCSSVF